MNLPAEHQSRDSTNGNEMNLPAGLNNTTSCLRPFDDALFKTFVGEVDGLLRF